MAPTTKLAGRCRIPRSKQHSPVHHLLMNVLPVLTVVLGAHFWVETLKRNSSNIHSAPHGHWRTQRDMFLYTAHSSNSYSAPHSIRCYFQPPLLEDKTPNHWSTSGARQEVLLLEAASYRWSLRALRWSSHGSWRGGGWASLPWGDGNGQSPGWFRSQWRGDEGNRSASRPRRSGCPLGQTEDKVRHWHVAEGWSLFHRAANLGWRPPSGCSWDCIWQC